MTTSYWPQATQVDEKPPWEPNLNLTLTQHPYDEDLETQEMCLHLEVEPPQAWYYHIFLNFCTLLILLQVDPTSSDEPKIVYEGYYKIKDTSIFTWSSIPGVGHYRCLHSPICRLSTNNKADYLICTIRHILDFL
jgi:hypothetical protein